MPFRCERRVQSSFATFKPRYGQLNALFARVVHHLLHHFMVHSYVTEQVLHGLNHPTK